MYDRRPVLIIVCEKDVCESFSETEKCGYPIALQRVFIKCGSAKNKLQTSGTARKRPEKTRRKNIFDYKNRISEIAFIL